MTREEIDRKVWEWCEFKWAPGESHLKECRPLFLGRCRVCVERACLYYSIMGYIECGMSLETIIGDIIRHYEGKTGRVIRP